MGVLEGGLECAQLVQQLVGVRAGRVRMRPARSPAVAPAGAVTRGVGAGDLIAQFGDAPLGRQDVEMRRQHLFDDRVIGDLLDLLGQKADAQVLAGADLSPVERHLAHDQPEQRGLAGAVGADQTDAHARLDVQAGLVQDRLAAERLGDVGEMQHQTR